MKPVTHVLKHGDLLRLSAWLDGAQRFNPAGPPPFIALCGVSVLHLARDHDIRWVGPDNVKTAERRSKESDRGNMTAYINRLIREDGERNPKARNTKS